MQHFFQDGFSKKDSIQPNSNFQVVCLFQGEVDQLVCWKPTSTRLGPAKPSTTLQPVSPVRGFHRERRGWPWHSFLDWKKQCPMILNLRTFEGWCFFRWNNLKPINLAIGSWWFFREKFVNASRLSSCLPSLGTAPHAFFRCFSYGNISPKCRAGNPRKKWSQAIQRFILIQTTQDETIQTKTIETKKWTTIISKQLKPEKKIPMKNHPYSIKHLLFTWLMVPFT